MSTPGPFPYPPGGLTGDPFFTATDLANRLQIDPAVINTGTATLLAQLASDAVRDDIRLTVDHIENDTVTMWGDYGTLLVLPERPVTDVSSVVIAGESLSPYQVGSVSTATPMFQWRPDGRLFRVIYGGSIFASELTWYWPLGVPIQITYSHGWQTPPSAMVGVALDVAARAYSNPEVLDSQRVGWVEWKVAQAGMTLTPDERTRLDPYRRLDI